MSKIIGFVSWILAAYGIFILLFGIYGLLSSK